jgi:hypothetical protein
MAAKSKSRKNTSKAGRSVRRAKVAKGLLEGKAPGEVAREQGISRAAAFKDAASPECRLLIAKALDGHAARIDALLVKSLDSIEAALGACKFQLVVTETTKDAAGETRSHKSIEVGVDHYARMTAVRRLIDLCLAGRPTPKPDEGPKEIQTITFEQFKTLLEKHTSDEDRGTQ